MKHSILKWGMYAVQTIVVIGIIQHANFWVSMIVILLVAATGMANYLLGWYARERAMPAPRDATLEELRGREPVTGWQVTPNPDGTLIWVGPEPPPCAERDVWLNPTEEAR